MNRALFTNIFRFIALVLFQVLVLKQVVIGESFWQSFQIIIYPLFIILLPINTSVYLVLLLGFVLGLTVDMFYDSPGVHTSATVFVAFIRKLILNILEPKGGYNIDYSPTRARMGFGWFFRYLSILLFAHLFWYFSVDTFTFFFSIGEIIRNTIASFTISLATILIIQIIFNPLE